MTRGRRRPDGERGLALLWLALSLTVLMAMAAFAVDVSYWYVQAQRNQRAADAAALAGVVFMPDGFDTAQDVAESSAAGNGFTADQLRVESVPGRSSQLKVTVTRDLQTFFGSALGLQRKTITRSAIAEYQGPVPMGSPVNGLGNEVILHCNAADFAVAADFTACQNRQEVAWVDPSSQGQFWLHVSSPNRAKSTGDAFQAANCSGSDGCSGSAITGNADYQDAGYFYTVRSPYAGRRLSIEAFDPAAIRVGDNCTNSNLNNASAIASALVPDARYRYASGQASPFCTGDEDSNGVTTYIVRAPDDTPWNNLDNPIVCREQFSGFDGALEPRLNPSKPEYSLTLADGRRVADVFRQWIDLCVINSAAAGDYSVQVRTNAALSAHPESAPLWIDSSAGNAGNRYALRAAYTNGTGARATGQSDSISIFAQGRLGLYANATGANTTFYLARVTGDAAGRVLALNFFDSGDASQAGRISIIPPAGVSLTGRCTYSGPSGPSATLYPNCILDPVSSGQMNGKWMRLAVRIPDTYTCNATDPEACWFLLRFTYPTGTNVSDTTSWQASVDGDPVRLVQ